MAASEQDKPPRVAPKLRAVPAIRELYWCDFPHDAQLPEFWKKRPVVVVSFKNTLHGTVTVIPCSSQDQSGNPWAYKLATTIDGEESWAVCDKPCTVAVSRLALDRRGKVRLPEAEFHGLLAILLRWLPRLPPSNGI